MIHRDHVLRGLMAACVIGLGLWVASCTEWVEKDRPTAAKGEAAKNPLYAAQKLARALGAQVAQPTGLAQLPPPGGTLWLTSWHWDLFPENARRLRAWVEGGGHLVVQSSMLGNDALSGWVPMDEHHPDDDEEDENSEDEEDADEASAPPPPSSPRSTGKPRDACRDIREPAGVPSRFADGRPFKLCRSSPRHLRQEGTARPPLWALGGPDNIDVLRIAVGKGSVTAIAPWGLFNNDQLFEGDHGALMVAALQLRRGTALWFVTEESRPGLLRWLWQEAWVAVMLGALALAFALWRGAVRFGPLAAAEVPVRRSMAEQITGTAQFLRLRGAGALHAAQIRALDETVHTHLPNYRKLGRGERAAMLAKVSGLDAQAIATALDRSLHRTPHAMAATLELIETARRRVLQAARERTLVRLLSHTPSPPAR